MVEDSKMFELFEKDMDKVIFILESSSIFLPNVGALNNIKKMCSDERYSFVRC